MNIDSDVDDDDAVIVVDDDELLILSKLVKSMNSRKKKSADVCHEASMSSMNYFLTEERAN